jgi:hypothetical protein
MCDNIESGSKERFWKIIDWIYVAQDRDQWWDVVNTVANIPAP